MSEIKVTVDVGAMRQQICDQMMELIFAFGSRAKDLAPETGTPVEVVFRDSEIQRIVKQYAKKIDLMERITQTAPPDRGEFERQCAKELLKFLVVETIKAAPPENKLTASQWILSVWHAMLPTFRQRLIEEGYMQPEAET